MLYTRGGREGQCKEGKGEGRRVEEKEQGRREGEGKRKRGRRRAKQEGGRDRLLLQSGIVKWQCNVQGCSAYVHLMSVMRHQDMRYC